MSKIFDEYKFKNLLLNESSILEIILNQPEIHNAFDDIFIDELIHVFETLKDNLNQENDANYPFRLVTIEGEGQSFCAGANLNWMKKMKDYSLEDNRKDSFKLAKMFQLINECQIPVVAFVRGAAIGGGAGLLAVCDFVLAEKSSKIAFSEVKLGLVPAVISPYVIAKIGQTWARGYFLSGMIFDAEKALTMGLVHQVCNKIDNEMKKKIIELFLKSAPIACQKAKALIQNVDGAGKEKDIFNYTVDLISNLRVGREGQEGMQALLDKKKASWIF